MPRPTRFAIENGDFTMPGTPRAPSQPEPIPSSSPMVTSASTATKPAIARLAIRVRTRDASGLITAAITITTRPPGSFTAAAAPASSAAVPHRPAFACVTA